ncbi:MAG: hypothetical protein LKI58_10230 [Actinomyces sp.]|jgi:chromosome segregation ATPase|nr:hypothetical protein [Actinomyces sp.]MCI1788420.1 hypothetical protein [Actinomyces sp.]
MSTQEQISTDTNEQENTVSDTEHQDTQDTTTEDTSTEEAQQEETATEDEQDKVLTEDENDEEHKGSSAREIRYRRRLREVEAERDTLTETVADLQRSIAEGLLTDILDKPASLWLTDHKVGDYFEDGQIDAEQLQADARDATKTLGLAPTRRFKGSAGGGVKTGPQTRQVSWQDALRG